MSNTNLVGVARFELATPGTPCRCAARLRHTPLIGRHFRNRTRDSSGWNAVRSARVSLCLVEDSGIEPLTLPCHGSVFPTIPIPLIKNNKPPDIPRSVWAQSVRQGASHPSNFLRRYIRAAQGFTFCQSQRFVKNGTLDGIRTRSACDLNAVCLPIPPPGR